MYAAVWILWSLKNFIIKKISIIKKNSLLSGVVRMFGGYHSLAQDIFVPLILIIISHLFVYVLCERIGTKFGGNITLSICIILITKSTLIDVFTTPKNILTIFINTNIIFLFSHFNFSFSIPREFS